MTDVENASRFLHENKLNLNISKCKWTLFGTPKILRRNLIPEISVNGKALEHVNSYWYLGWFIIDATLSRSQHIDNMCKKLRRRIGRLRRIQTRHVNFSLLLYNALILPVFEICIYKSICWCVYIVTNFTSLPYQAHIQWCLVIYVHHSTQEWFHWYFSGFRVPGGSNW